ncbi:MAG: EAL domain-containing protein [Candidatus Nitrohelix vancouverensis]|uniref:EAL domain-containing protein n=1 Tax=Candidatus Nitrohelix vancouverensis TaxID=2705534 RepID=A0A7T0G4F3_9BACT|nr:MAG: EAL domain-containing protein [Candidatus Nitrohelix vancouverensis]
MSRDILESVLKNEFEVYFQPQVDEKMELVGLEALARWRRAGTEWAPPSRFIPIAEESGSIIALGNWIFSKACHSMRSFQTDFFTNDISLSVNFSTRQLESSRLPGFIGGLLAKADLPPWRLTVEITESRVVENFEAIVACLHELRSMGIRVALDDFGVGHSSLSRLAELPVDIIKIDARFTRNLPRPSACLMFDGIVKIARDFKLNIVVEGVETWEQRNFLLQYAPLSLQGYLLGKPMGLETLKEFLTKDEMTVHPESNYNY